LDVKVKAKANQGIKARNALAETKNETEKVLEETRIAKKSDEMDNLKAQTLTDGRETSPLISLQRRPTG
jgi:hypothetical protein